LLVSAKDSLRSDDARSFLSERLIAAGPDVCIIQLPTRAGVLVSRSPFFCFVMRGRASAG
jgi:hypothetical protein